MYFHMFSSLASVEVPLEETDGLVPLDEPEELVPDGLVLPDEPELVLPDEPDEHVPQDEPDERVPDGLVPLDETDERDELEEMELDVLCWLEVSDESLE